VQPLHDESDEEVFTVSPPPPLLMNPQEDNNLTTFLVLQEGQIGFSFPKIRSSKFFPQLSQ
jgi:hypothetical protein